MAQFQLVGYLKLLAEYDVDYLIVGGVGGRIQGAATTTQDLDIMPNPDPENLERLAQALTLPTTRKKATHSTTYEDHSTVDSIEFKTEDVLSFDTSYGAIDVLMELPGVGLFADVARRAKRYRFEDLELTVADLTDIIRSKETTDRAKDWRAMDALYEAREQLKQQSDKFEIGPDQLDL